MACQQKEMLGDRDATKQREREIQSKRKNCHEKERQEKRGVKRHQEIQILGP